MIDTLTHTWMCWAFLTGSDVTPSKFQGKRFSTTSSLSQIMQWSIVTMLNKNQLHLGDTLQHYVTASISTHVPQFVSHEGGMPRHDAAIVPIQHTNCMTLGRFAGQACACQHARAQSMGMKGVDASSKAHVVDDRHRPPAADAKLYDMLSAAESAEQRVRIAHRSAADKKRGPGSLMAPCTCA